MATNADNRCPTASGSIRAEYPVTTPRDSSLRTRDWTAETDSPAFAANSDKRRAAVGNERAHQDPVDVVERLSHGRRVSQR